MSAFPGTRSMRSYDKYNLLFLSVTGKDLLCWLYIYIPPPPTALYLLDTLPGWIHTYSDLQRIQWPNEYHSHYKSPQFTVLITLQCIRKRSLMHAVTSKHFWRWCITIVVACVLNSVRALVFRKQTRSLGNSDVLCLQTRPRTHILRFWVVPGVSRDASCRESKHNFSVLHSTV
jgi:hypothetical protein